jgi:hypothetical protein
MAISAPPESTRPKVRLARLSLLLSCAVAGAPGSAQQNLDFESLESYAGVSPPGWRATGEGASELDAENARSGAYALRMTVTAGAASARVAQEIDAGRLPGDRLRLSGAIKGAIGTGSSAGLWIRIEGERGLFYVDGTRGRTSPAADEWQRWTIEAPLAPQAREISFGAELRGEGEIWLDDFTLETLDTRTLPEPAPAAARYVDYALEIIRENTVKTNIDWPAYTAAVKRQLRGARTIQDSHLTLRFALSTLDDGHSYFMTPGQMSSLERTPVANARTGRSRIAPRGELLDGSIGYLLLPGFAGGTQLDQVAFAEELQAAIATLDRPETCGWIVDLRENSGGNLWPMIAGIGPLLGEGEAAISLYPNGERRSVWYRGGKAGLGEFVQLRVADPPYRIETPAPVAVLIGRSTASSAEVIAVAFSARGESRSFGTPTRGATTGTRIFPLSDDAALVLAVAATSDRHGRVYPGPIAPNEPVAASGRELALAEQAAVRAAAQWLKSHDGCQI